MFDGTSDVRHPVGERRPGSAMVQLRHEPDSGDGQSPDHRDAGTASGRCRASGRSHAGDAVGDVVAELGVLLLDRVDLADVATLVLEPCARAVGPDAEIALSLRWTDDDGREIAVREATTRRAHELAAWQDLHGEGPLRTASEHGVTCVVDGDPGDRCGVADFVEESGRRGLHSGAAFPLVVGDEVRGALGVMYPCADAITPARVRAGQELARVVAPTVWNVLAHREKARLAEQLTVALEGRAIIERAKGVLMGELGLCEESAFDLLATQSQHENVKLRNVAAQLLEARRRR